MENNKFIYDVIIIGAGPAGISSSLYTKRGNLKVAIISKKESNLLDAHWVDNYYGFPAGISGKDLFENGLKQALKLGVDIFNDEVVGIDYTGDFAVKTMKNTFVSKSLILTTGSKKNSVDIKGLDNYLYNGVSYCAICDGFFYKNRKVAVLGNKQYALHELNTLKNISSDISLFTNGADLDISIEELDNVKIYKEKITEVVGEEKLQKVILENSKEVLVDGLFVALGSAKTSELALKLGVITENNKIKVNEKMETNIPGLYAAGDAVKGLQQISKAVYEGSVAGVEAIKFLKKQK